jgi:hypothetical protein
VCPAVLSADHEVVAQREWLKQTNVLREKNGSVAGTEPEKLIRGPFAYTPDRDYHVQEEATG